MTNDLIIKFKNEEIGFDIEQYNQIYIFDYYTFFKVFMKLKEYEGIKFDDYHTDKIKGDIFLYNQKITKKNTLIMDLNDFSTIISNLTFKNGSLLKDIYIKLLENNITIDKIESITKEFSNLFTVDESIEFELRDPNISKILDLFFMVYFNENKNYLKEPTKIVNVIKRYLDLTEKRAIIFIDSSIKAFEYEKLVKDERIIVLDTSIDLNKLSNNLIFIRKNKVDNININILIENIIYYFPIEINSKEVLLILKTYLRVILNDDIKIYDKPSDKLLVTYIVVRNLLELDLDKKYIKEKSNGIEDKIIQSYINNVIIK